MEKMLELALIEGEGLKVEFKERLSNLDREIVAFANTLGGVIYLGVEDSGKIIGITIDNQLKSQVADIAHNCDPSIQITFHEHRNERVLAVHVGKGNDKPYRCKEGFYIRNGPSTQKLKRDEIITMINQTDKARFDESLNEVFQYPKDFSEEALNEYLSISGITTHAALHHILVSLSAAQEEHGQLKFTNAGVLFFAKDPQRFFPESYITAVKYKTSERFDILDKKDFKGSPISQIENTLAFVLRHMNVEPRINMSNRRLGARKDIYEYSPIAIREAVINAVTHRDYLYDSSHIYVHMFPDYIEIENPGGLYRGLALEDLGKRSIRRNRLIADLLHRSGFIERVGSGFSRMENALIENSNPPLEVQASNFFNIRFYKRLADIEPYKLTSRQIEIYQIISNQRVVNKRDLVSQLHVSEDTILRDLNSLIKLGVVIKQGRGKSIAYHLVNE
ncbi:MAG: RNA-binding domain-containing protein [Chlamydiales bacterium]